jgi:hypothetical protein
MRSCPLQRSTETGARITRRIPPAGTVRPQGFSPSRRLASPVTMAGLFHPTCVPGVEPGPRSLAETFRSRQGRTRPGSLFTAFSPPTTSTCWRALLPCTSSGSPAKRNFGDPTSGEAGQAAQRVLRSLDRGGLGVSRGSEPRAPAILRFVADLHTRELATSTRPLGCPSTLRAVADVIESLRNLSRSYRKLAPPAPRACVTAADPATSGS